ncbi:hypothetical protein [Modestobacter sp. URMC 112]
MTAVLPAPVDLPGPPGSPQLLEAALEQLTGAAFAAGTVSHLLEPVAVLQGWQGADAAVAGAEVAAATAVAGRLHAALSAAIGRLEAYAETWQLVERRVDELRRQQEAQFASASPRLAVASDPSVTVVPPDAAALLQEVEADESARAAEHRELLAELADDADRTAAVLEDAGGSFGGTGRRGDAARVRVHLAAALPGWGTGLMAGLGARAARELTGPGTADDLTAAALRSAPYAGVPAFAVALVAGLGADGVAHLLASSAAAGPSGGGGEGPAPLAVLLARVLTAAGTEDLRVAGVTGRSGTGRLLPPRDPDAAVDAVAVAMGRVLAVPGVSPGLAASWGRALLERERAQGASPVARTTPTAPDPADTALRVLAASGDRRAAAELLATPEAWAAALARPWPDGGAALARVIGLAGASREGGVAGGAALAALGEGLQPGTDRTVTGDEETLATVRDVLGGLLAEQVQEVVGMLGPVAAGGLPDATVDARLRGLARLLLQPGQQAVLVGALADALRAGTIPAVEAAAVAGGFVAVQEYGERLRHALACAEGLADAAERRVTFDVLVRMPTAVPRELLGRVAPLGEELADAVVDGLAVAVDAEGEYAPPDDTGVVRTEEDATRFAVLSRPAADPSGPGTAAAVLEQAAHGGFQRTAAVLGVPPVAEESIDVLDRFEPPDREHDRRPTRGPARGR